MKSLGTYDVFSASVPYLRARLQNDANEWKRFACFSNGPGSLKELQRRYQLYVCTMNAPHTLSMALWLP